MTNLDKVREALAFAESELNSANRYDAACQCVSAITALSAHEQEVAELEAALRDCVEALAFIEERTATRTNPPTLERARAALRPFTGDEK